MTRDHASLQRRPFLTPIWLTVLGAMLGVSFLAFAGWVWGTADSTTLVIVRHAEKQLDVGADPPLTPAGEARAGLLMHMFGSPGGTTLIDAIYVSPALRSRMTAAPLAARLGLMPIVAPGDAPRELARRALREHSGGRILIVAHGDTIPDIIAALGARTRVKPLDDQDYGAMYVVSVPRVGRVNVLQISY